MKIKPLIVASAAVMLAQFVGCRAELDWQEGHDLGVAALEAGDVETAREHLAASSTRADALGESHLFFEKSMVSLARAQEAAGMLSDAERNYRRAYVVREARVGAESQELTEILVPLADVCEAQGKSTVAANMRQHVFAQQGETELPSTD